MANVTFITGNQGKADFLAKHIDHPIAHQKIDLDEIQSLDINEIAEHKAQQAYKIVQSPVLVEDVSLTFESLGNLPGPFIKWFEIELGLERICGLVDGLKSRRAVASVCFVYFDGTKLKFFNGKVPGSIAYTPKGSGGFGFDPIFIPYNSEKTLAEMDERELEEKSLRTSTVYPEIKKFLAELDPALTLDKK
jgi:non-canonical purine NTP pyrophosphatase (RdgB/HAM1 family)